MRTIARLAALLLWALVARADDAPRFAGQWKSTFGVVSLEQQGDAVTGHFGVGRFPIRGTAKGSELKFEYDEGQAKGDATFTLDPSGNAYTGTFQVRGGRRGVWNGWRPDPAASNGRAADFSGVWLTDLGLMALTQEGTHVRGRYALRGTSSLEGDVTGRHLEFRYKGFRGGPGWFDLDPEGATLAGASGADGAPGWSGWKGRKGPEFVRHVPLAAGTLADGSTDSLLTYTVRAPEGYKHGEGKKWPCIVVLHGSNMNAKSYVSTLAAAWPDVARDYILIGINGETASRIDDDPAFNYTYVSYVGRSTFGGFPGKDRESPALVAEALAELKKAYPIEHYFVGGHSQGGFLTYSLLMNSPELIAGAFPISAGVIMQCEPSAYADEKLKTAQRGVPLAIVHGRTDPMVPYSMGEYAHGLFADAGWPALRLFSDDGAAHMFARLPVGPAIRWLEVMTSNDPAVLLDFAERRWKESGRRDAVAAVLRLRGIKLDKSSNERLGRLTQMIDAEVAPKVKGYVEAIRAAKDNTWVDGFLAFRDDYAFADAASEVMAAYTALRAKHDEPARKLMNEARGLFQQGRRDEGYAKAKEVVDKYFASSSYRIAKGWLAEKK